MIADSSRTSNLPEDTIYIRRLIAMWLENPSLIPNRICRSIDLVAFETTTSSRRFVADIILWDPITQFKIDLACPHYIKVQITNQLHVTRWKDGTSPRDQPRKLYCIQKCVLLVSRVYRCPVGHQILAHDPWLLQVTASKISSQIPFVLFHKSGVTRELFLYIFTHVQAGVKLTDIERLISQMYTDGAQTVLCRQNPTSDAQRRLEMPGRQITTNCFVRAYFEFEHMYAQHMSEIPFLWLSADHTFKISTNIGFWHRGAWAKQYDSLFCVLNEKGQVVTWQLTKGRFVLAL